MYKAQTRGISVTVQPRFVEEESSPSESRYFFAYTVEIVNNGAEQVQLRSRHWRIIDGRGALQEVRGAGVVGKQPVLEPGESAHFTGATIGFANKSVNQDACQRAVVQLRYRSQ